MPINRTLWLAILAGTALTGLLMLILYNQVKPPEQPEAAASQPVSEERIPVQTMAPPPTNAPKSEINNQQNTGIRETPNPTAKDKVPSATTKPATPSNKTDPESPAARAKLSTPITDLPGLPADPTLSPQDIEQLSPQEREQYEVLVKTYQEVRAQVLNLHREREELRQKMDGIIEENTEMDQQLEQLRQQHNKTQN